MGSKHQLTEPAEETFESSAKHQSTVLTVGPPKSLFLALLAFRLLNSLAVQTYFNPDEFWQGPEVAHRMVFGYGYLTWEWQPEWAARSFLHPLLFAAGYRLLALLRCDTPWLVRHSPRFMQAAMAALADLRLYALTRRLFPSHPSAAAWALLCNLTCWFLLFCATRTFSNSLEASLSVIALSYWPWRHCQGDTEGAQDTGEGTQGRTEAAKGRGAEQGRGGGQLSATAQVSDLRGANRPLALALAAAACMVRPTSTPFWLPLGLHELALLLLEGTLKGGKDSSRGRWEWVRLLLLEVLPIGLIAVAITVAVDSWQYGQPMVFTPLNLLRFNVHLKGSSLYGSNPWHWYWSQGLIAMHGTFFPLACLGLLWCSFFHPSAPSDSPPRYTHLHHLHHLLQHLQQGLVWWSVRLPFLLALWLPLFYSLSDHKEHRFILLSLPLLNTYAALALSLLNEEREREHSRLATTCNNCNTSNTKPHTPGQSPPLHQASNSLKPPEPSQLPNPSQRSTSSRSGPADQSWRAFLSPFLHPQSPLFRLLLTAAFLPQLLAALYLSTSHQRGTISVMPFLEGEIHGILQTHSTPSRDVGRGGGIEGEGGGNEGGEGVREGRVEVLFLMPCHSTPFHSHLHNPAVTLTMLSCAPILTSHPNGTITMSREREFEDLLADPRDFLSSRYTIHTSVHACISGLGHGATAGAAAARPATAASAAAAAAAHSATAASHCVYDATADFHAGTPATCRGSSSGTAEQGACMHGEHGHALADGHEHEHGGGGGEAAADVRACAGDFEQIEGRCLDGCYGVDGGGRPELPDLVVAFDTEELLLLPFLRCAGYTEVARFFHAHFPVDRELQGHVLAYRKHVVLQ